MNYLNAATGGSRRRKPFFSKRGKSSLSFPKFSLPTASTFALQKYSPVNMMQFKKYILYNKFVLYLLFLLSIIQLLAFILRNRFDLFSLFGIFIFSLFYFYSKNLVVVLGLSLILIHLFQFILSIFGYKEGLTGGDENNKVTTLNIFLKAEGKPKKEIEIDDKTTILDVLKSQVWNTPSYSYLGKNLTLYHKKKELDKNKTFTSYKIKPGATFVIKPSAETKESMANNFDEPDDEENEEIEKYETQAPQVGASESMKDMGKYEALQEKEKKRNEIDYTKTMTSNLEMYNDLLESDGFSKMTADTQNLMEQQERLSKSMTQFMPLISQMTPFLEKANGLLQGVDLKSMNKLTSTFAQVE